MKLFCDHQWEYVKQGEPNFKEIYKCYHCGKKRILSMCVWDTRHSLEQRLDIQQEKTLHYMQWALEGKPPFYDEMKGATDASTGRTNT